MILIASQRKIKNQLMGILFGLSALAALFTLFSILWYVVKQGLPGLNLSFFTNLPAPVGVPGGGMGNAIIGTIILVLLSSIISIPVGVAAGILLAEYGDNNTFHYSWYPCVWFNRSGYGKILCHSRGYFPGDINDTNSYAFYRANDSPGT